MADQDTVENEIPLFPCVMTDLLCEGSRVRLLDGIRGPLRRISIDSPVTLPTHTVTRITEGGVYTWVSDGRECFGMEAAMLSLDIAEASSRANLARWMAQRLKLKPSPLQAVFTALRGISPAWGGVAWSLDADPGKELLFAEPEGPNKSSLAWVTFGSEATSQDYGGPLRLHVPVLARLNQDDPRLLQDGSRVVDALAQVHVALYILHRTKEIT